MLTSARQIWRASIPAQRTLGAEYLGRLGIPLDTASVRFNLLCHPVGAPRGRTMPAVVFAYMAGETLAGLERHFIDPDTTAVVSRDVVG
ncbi:MAG: hypothetical protein WA936_14440, partial [Erythrobacter sp.]